MMGIPPATAASKWMAELCWRERAKSSSPRSARRALFPVTTVLPSLRAAATMSNAVVVPPMSSTTMSTSGSLTTSFQSEVKSLVGASSMRFLVISLTAALTMFIANWLFERPLMRVPFFLMVSHTPVPTVPKPTSPTPTCLGVLFCCCSVMMFEMCLISGLIVYQ